MPWRSHTRRAAQLPRSSHSATATSVQHYLLQWCCIIWFCNVLPSAIGRWSGLKATVMGLLAFRRGSLLAHWAVVTCHGDARERACEIFSVPKICEAGEGGWKTCRVVSFLCAARIQCACRRNVFQHHQFYVCKKHGQTQELHKGYCATSSNTLNNFRKWNRILLDVTFRHVNVLSKLLSRNSLYIGLQVGCLCACYP